MPIKIALAGNSDYGKTTLFNGLTGSSQFIGNWPGVTVEKKRDKFKGNKDIIITDLPGIYSLSPYTLEEVVARNYLITERPDAILNVADRINLERNLYLTIQLMELEIPMLMAVNMMDAAKKSGDQVNIQALSRGLNCPVVKISVLKGTGIMEVTNKVMGLVRGSRVIATVHKLFADVEIALEGIKRYIGGSVPGAQRRFYAIKLSGWGDKIAVQMTMVPDVGSIIARMEDAVDDDAESITTNGRCMYITPIIGRYYTKKNREKMSVSDEIDHIVTNRFLALPTFAAVMWVIYYVSVTTVGTWVTDQADDGMFGERWSLLRLEVSDVPIIVGGFLTAVGCADWFPSLILDGIVAGVGAVLGFAPWMLVLFTFLAPLESYGYIVRMALIMDRIFYKFGLSGKSSIPMLIGTGCGVPDIMVPRTIENDKGRKMTIMTTTFIPCRAKLPIVVLSTGVLFGGTSRVVPSAYFVGIVVIICSDTILKKIKISADSPTPLVMELPAYHLPAVLNALRSAWERGWSFTEKVGIVVLLPAVFAWFISGSGFVDGHLGMVEDLSDGILALTGQVVAWTFAPFGQGNQQAVAMIITGLVTKENIAGTFGILYGFVEVAEGGAEIWGTLARNSTAVSAYSSLVFNLLYAPCFAAMDAIKHEMNNARWTRFAIGYQTVLAYVITLYIYQFGNWFTAGTFGVGTVVAIAAVAGFIYLLVRPYKENNSLNVNAKARTAL